MAERRKRRVRQASFPRRGEIYLVSLDPTVGHEIRKTRPALVIQNDTTNEFLGTTIVAPITSAIRFPLSPAHVLLVAGNPSGLEVTSMALLDQIRTVDKKRLIEKLGRITPDLSVQVDEAIAVSLGLAEIP